MKKFIVERNVPGAGKMTAKELETISQTSTAVISILGRPYNWIQSFVTEDRIYCIHEAENEDDVANMQSAEAFLLTESKK